MIKELMLLILVLVGYAGFSQSEQSHILDGLLPGNVDAHYLPNTEKEAPIQHLPAFVPGSPTPASGNVSTIPPVHFVKGGMEKLAKTPKSFQTESAPARVNATKLDTYVDKNPKSQDANMKIFSIGLVAVLGIIGFVLYSSKPIIEPNIK